VVRLGIADQRGDGRPDYAYSGWLLYADTVSPPRLPASGGQIVIQGVGFHASDTVLVGGQPAAVLSVTPNEITAVAPPAASGLTGSVDVEVDDLPIYHAAAIISGGVSYDSGSGDALTINAAPSNTVPIGVAQPFSVTALGANLSPAAGVTVTYAVTSGPATLACGQKTCAVTTTGDGHATINVTAASAALSIVTASLTNGSMVEAQFTGGTPPTIAALTPRLSVAAGATVTWPVQALVLANGAPQAGQSVTWQAAAGFRITVAGAVITNANGVAAQNLTVGPLAEGQLVTITACVTATSQCATFSALGSRPEYATLVPVSGTEQSISVNATPNPIVLRVLDMDGNPMAAGTVTLNESLYA
ncbi:MAG: IPT/TIG domain-containing protein, partial [Terracidiphilus sp.]